jgi:uncharacterized protein (DUF2164 family)
MENIFTKKAGILFIVTAIAILLTLRQCNTISTLKVDLKRTEKIAQRNLNNYKTAQDSITVEKNKQGDLVSKIGTYEYDISTLKKDKSIILKKYNKVIGEKTKLKDINTLISTDLIIKDSIINANVKIVQNTDTIFVNFNDNLNFDKFNWRKFNGKIKLTKVDSLFTIDSSKFYFNQGISLTTAIVEENGRDILKITTKYPGLEFTSIESISVVNDKLNERYTKEAGWSIGFGVGYGVNLNSGQVISNGPSIGIGLYWSPKWLKF